MITLHLTWMSLKTVTSTYLDPSPEQPYPPSGHPLRSERSIQHCIGPLAADLPSRESQSCTVAA